MNMEINPSEYKILIVDDVMSNVLLLKVLLTNEKFAIATASNGRQALEQVEKENPDLVLANVVSKFPTAISAFDIYDFICGKNVEKSYVFVDAL